MMTHDHGSTGHRAASSTTPPTTSPKAYRDTIFIGNVVTNRINHDRARVARLVARRRSRSPTSSWSDDPWFRPVDIKLGPDGALYVADFYNRIIGHYEVPLTHPGRDRERGRIWRIVYSRQGRQERPGRPSRRLVDGDDRRADRRPRPPEPGGPHAGGEPACRRPEPGRPVVGGSGRRRRRREPWPASRTPSGSCTGWGALDRRAARPRAAIDPDRVVRVHALRILGRAADARRTARRPGPRGR